MRSIYLLIIYTFLGGTIGIQGARILGVFMGHFKSHLLIHEAVADTLYQAGHNVTVLSNLPSTNPTAGYNVIQVPANNFDASKMTRYPSSIYRNFKVIMEQNLEKVNESLQHPTMQKFLRTHKAGDFDLMVFGYFYNDFLLGLAAHFQCPVVLSFMVQSVFTIDHMMGNPRDISYVPSLYSGLKQPLDFKDRLKNLYSYFMEEFILLPWTQKRMEHYYRNNFPLTRYKPLKEVYENISLVFLNHHFTQGPIRPNQPSFIEIGGIQIPEQPQPWPQDLEEALKLDEDNTYKGIIYFSLGSMIDGDNLDTDKAKIMFRVLSQMPYQVIMKWNNKSIPLVSRNIICRPWLPQTDILADKRTKLFITHGGQGGIAEAQYYATPMVGLPFFGDQYTNMERLVKFGFGLQLDINTLTETSFRQAIQTVLENPQYKENVEKFSQLYRDRPLSSRQLIKYWVDYVLRYQGAKHMQSPAIYLNWWQQHLLDIIGFIFLLIIMLLIVIVIIAKYIYYYFVNHKGKMILSTKRNKRMKQA